MSVKGSKPRPLSVPREVRDANHETIFGKKPPKERWIPPPLPESVTDSKTDNK
jgi:hypothetical protein